MRIAYTLSCLAAFTFPFSPAVSAENPVSVLEISGKVLVITPTGLTPAEVGQVIPEGTKIFVGDESIARLAAADGNCDLNLPPRKVTVVTSSKICSDVTITPAAANPPHSIPPFAVGLSYFASVIGMAGIAHAVNDGSISLP